MYGQHAPFLSFFLCVFCPRLLPGGTTTTTHARTYTSYLTNSTDPRLPGLREQVTTLRGRAQAAAWPRDKKAAIVAALLRYEGLHERELRALQITESATVELQRARREVGGWVGGWMGGTDVNALLYFLQ